MEKNLFQLCEVILGEVGQWKNDHVMEIHSQNKRINAVWKQMVFLQQKNEKEVDFCGWALLLAVLAVDW